MPAECAVQSDPCAGLPVPRPDETFYAAELEACLEAGPGRRENWERAAKAPRVAVVDHDPVKMDFENVSRCNFRCPKCQSSSWPGGRRARDMEVAEFAGLLDAMPGLVEIKLQGVGEPLLGGAAYFEMIRLARARRIWVRTTTNASLLHRDGNAERLVEADPCEVQVSLDGATPEVMREIRRGSDFRRVTENCRRLNAAFASRGLVRTRMWTCLQRQNLPQLEALVRLAAELGFQRLTFGLDLHDWGQAVIRERLDGLSVRNEEVAGPGGRAVELGRSLGVEVSFWRSVQKFDVHVPEKLCPWPFQRAFVSSDMRIVPCCMIANPDIFSLGAAEDFPAVWRGPVYRAFRRAHLEGRPPRVCRTCYDMPLAAGGREARTMP